MRYKILSQKNDSPTQNNKILSQTNDLVTQITLKILTQ